LKPSVLFTYAKNGVFLATFRGFKAVAAVLKREPNSLIDGVDIEPFEVE